MDTWSHRPPVFSGLTAGFVKKQDVNLILSECFCIAHLKQLMLTSFINLNPQFLPDWILKNNKDSTTAIRSYDKGQVDLQSASTFTEKPERSIESNERRLEKDGDNKNGHRLKTAQ